MTIRAYIQAAISICIFGCSQGPSWEPPEDEAYFADAGDTIEQNLDTELQVKVLTPYQTKGCVRVGDFVHLEASVTSATPVSVKWSFERTQAGCEPIVLAVLDSPTTHTDAYSMFMWSTSCAMDVPDGCGVGQGTIEVEVTDEHGHAVIDQVAFCLDEPASSKGAAVNY